MYIPNKVFTSPNNRKSDKKYQCAIILLEEYETLEFATNMYLSSMQPPIQSLSPWLKPTVRLQPHRFSKSHGTRIKPPVCHSRHAFSRETHCGRWCWDCRKFFVFRCIFKFKLHHNLSCVIAEAKTKLIPKFVKQKHLTSWVPFDLQKRMCLPWISFQIPQDI